jgi:hypothetical protein
MAEQRELEVTIISAQDLKNVSTFGKMSPYAEVWIHPSRKVATPVHTHGGTDPSWNALLRLVCEESLIEQGSGVLHIEILNHGTLSSKEIGLVSVPLSQVIPRDDKNSSQAKTTSLQVQKPSGGFHGILHLSVKLGSLITKVATTQSTSATEYRGYNTTTAYPPAGYNQQQTSNQYQYPPQGYQPQLVQGQYAAQGQLPPQYAPSQYPPQGQFPPQYAPSGYGAPQYAAAPQYPPQYAPAPQGYYPQQPYAQPVQVVQQQQPARSGLGGGGLGLGAGLLGGAVGGLVLGEVLDDFGDRNDGGGCGGGGDCGGGGGCGGN